MTLTPMKINPEKSHEGTQLTGGVAVLKNLQLLDSLMTKVKERGVHLPGLATFSGPSGFGKSTAAGFCAARHQACYIEIRSSWTRRAFLEAVLQSMGIKPAATICRMVDQVSDELASSARPLILDEFDNAVNQNLVELVRDIYEQSRSPVVLIGEELLPQKLQKWERFHGRIMEWAQAQPADLNDARILNRHYAPDVTVADDLMRVVVELSRGSVRRIVTNLERITKYAKTDGKKTISAKDWGDQELHMATPPQARKKFN